MVPPSLNHVDIGCNNYHPVVFIVSSPLTLYLFLSFPSVCNLIAVASVNDIVSLLLTTFLHSLFFFVGGGDPVYLKKRPNDLIFDLRLAAAVHLSNK